MFEPDHKKKNIFYLINIYSKGHKMIYKKYNYF